MLSKSMEKFRFFYFGILLISSVTWGQIENTPIACNQALSDVISPNKLREEIDQIAEVTYYKFIEDFNADEHGHVVTDEFGRERRIDLYRLNEVKRIFQNINGHPLSMASLLSYHLQKYLKGEIDSTFPPLLAAVKNYLQSLR